VPLKLSLLLTTKMLNITDLLDLEPPPKVSMLSLILVQAIFGFLLALVQVLLVNYTANLILQNPLLIKKMEEFLMSLMDQVVFQVSLLMMLLLLVEKPSKIVISQSPLLKVEPVLWWPNSMVLWVWDGLKFLQEMKPLFSWKCSNKDLLNKNLMPFIWAK